MRRPARNRLLDGLHGNVAKVLCLVVLTAGAAAIQPAVAAHQPARRTTRPSLAAGVLARLNRIRQSNGLAPLAVSPQLVAAARQHSVEMLADGYFGHDSQNGSPFWKRVWRYYGRAAVGENLLWAMPDVGAARAVELWMASPEHRSVILDGSWREIGIGPVHANAAPGTFLGRAVTVITTDFGARR